MDIISRKDRLTYLGLVFLWYISVSSFWIWWMRPEHVANPCTLTISTLLLLWTTLIPGYCFYFAFRMKKLRDDIKIPNFRIAVVVTKVPSEPLELLKKTLIGSLQQKTPHDTWLADEDPSQETIDWCTQNGIQISTRKNVNEYHNSSWPRKTKTKEGNLAYFYDKYGYDKYDIVVQMDADHIPMQGYLEEMIKPFIISDVGYVSAPSVCNLNKDDSWAVKARYNNEAVMHGPIQSGYTDGWAPLCIGSHYAVRTKALKEIGGLGPELAEDYTTSLWFNSNGWKGICAVDANAQGLGPESFADLIIQDFQWAKSLTRVLLIHYKTHYKNLSKKLKFQFLFTQLWYPAIAITMLINYLLPLIAVYFDVPLVRVNLIEFIFRLSLVFLACFMVIEWLRKKNYLRPIDSMVFSWENLLFEYVRWPWVLIAIYSGVSSVIIKKEMSFKVTSKDKDMRPLPIKILTPYLILALIPMFFIVLFSGSEQTSGYQYINLFNSIIYSLIAVLVVAMHVKENENIRVFIRPVSAALGTFIGVIILSYVHFIGIPQLSNLIIHPQKEILTGSNQLAINTSELSNEDLGNNTHIVERGDTLWKIAEEYYGNGNEWSKLALANKEKVTYSSLRRPLIEPGERLTIP